MEKTILVAVGSGILLAIGIFGFKGKVAIEDPRRAGVPTELQVLIDSRYNGLPTEPKGFAPHGWITVVEPPPSWNSHGAGVSYPICPRPEWFPYDIFVGPPVPEAAVSIDPSGYMFQTPEGIRVHRDGWVVTTDGRAFRAKELIDNMQFPQLPTDKGV